MEFQDLFDELESKFAGKRFEWNHQINCLKLQTIDKQFVDLLAPIIGVDFVAGLDRENADWMCLANCYIANFSPLQLEDAELPLLRQQEISMWKFIKTLDRPVRVAIKYLNQAEASFNLFDVDENFLIADSELLIPNQSIQLVRVLGTKSWP